MLPILYALAFSRQANPLLLKLIKELRSELRPQVKSPAKIERLCHQIALFDTRDIRRALHLLYEIRIPKFDKAFFASSRKPRQLPMPPYIDVNRIDNSKPYSIYMLNRRLFKAPRDYEYPGQWFGSGDVGSDPWQFSPGGEAHFVERTIVTPEMFFYPDSLGAFDILAKKFRRRKS